MPSKMTSNLTLVCNYLGIQNIEKDSMQVELRGNGKPCLCGHGRSDHKKNGSGNCDFYYCECANYVPAFKNIEVKK